jgi:hypothetical protein
VGATRVPPGAALAADRANARLSTASRDGFRDECSRVDPGGSPRCLTAARLRQPANSISSCGHQSVNGLFPQRPSIPLYSRSVLIGAAGAGCELWRWSSARFRRRRLTRGKALSPTMARGYADPREIHCGRHCQVRRSSSTPLCRGAVMARCSTRRRPSAGALSITSCRRAPRSSWRAAAPSGCARRSPRASGHGARHRRCA